MFSVTASFLSANPILGGLEFGHGPDPHAIPLGTIAELDADNGRLTFL
ncbi:hypothetical protein ACWDXV_16530 [Nocardia nova]